MYKYPLLYTGVKCELQLICSLLFTLSFRLKSNKELLESNFSIVGKFASRLLTCDNKWCVLYCYSCEVLSTKLKLGDWQKKIQNWFNLNYCMYM